MDVTAPMCAYTFGHDPARSPVHGSQCSHPRVSIKQPMCTCTGGHNRLCVQRIVGMIPLFIITRVGTMSGSTSVHNGDNVYGHASA